MQLARRDVEGIFGGDATLLGKLRSRTDEVWKMQSKLAKLALAKTAKEEEKERERERLAEREKEREKSQLVKKNAPSKKKRKSASDPTKKKRFNVKIADLIRGGYLKVGEEITYKSGVAKLSADGEIIEPNGHKWGSLSGWAQSVHVSEGGSSKSVVPGWDNVKARGKLLKEVRQQYIDENGDD
eukprot:TRINITY_DN606_c0_g1_i1.p1 TRINITY_DN606_c0_g1~~TRINITY_DN606_c0_g1_i1.p1  ORF type:complete len:193 (-),score=3.57 TRINITY_DN606_c0_g1_i1:56-607(-)